jgi:DNA-binding MarR family transcriptional regulator
MTDSLSTDLRESTGNELGLRFHEALHQLWNRLHPADREAICCHDITHTQWTLLRTLCEGGRKSLPMGLLSSQLGLTPSGVTRCAEPLVERKLVERGTQPGDRRVCCLKPTDAGVALYSTILCECAEREERLISHLPPDERKVLVQALEKIALAVVSESKAGVTS